MSSLSKLFPAPALVAAALAASLLGCAPAEAPAPVGALRISTSAIVPEVVRVTATLSGPVLPQVVHDLVQAADGTWSASVVDLAPGAIHVEVGAFNAAGAELFHGRGDATIVAGAVAALQIFAQEVAPPPSFGNNPPRIEAIAVSSLDVLTGGSVSMTVTATDVDFGASLTFLWRASAGTLSAPTAPYTQWTAPTTAGGQTIFVTVRDEKGAAAEASFTVSVTDSSTFYGTLALAVTLNRAPVVSDVSLAPSRVEVGQSTTLAATVTDRDGDAVAVQWTSDCPGTFGTPTSASTTFTPVNLQATGALCRLQLYADDGHGGSATGWTGLWVGPPPPVGPIAPPPPPPTTTGFVNGSFETGDYAGWQLLSFGSSTDPFAVGIWGIGGPGEVIFPSMLVRDFFSGSFLPATSPLLPVQILSTDGQFTAFQIPNGLGSYRLFQRITIPPLSIQPSSSAVFLLGAASLSPWQPGAQSVAIHLRDLNDVIIATPFMTDPTSQPDPLPRPIAIDLTPFAGQTIVFDVEIAARLAPVAVQLDGFQLN